MRIVFVHRNGPGQFLHLSQYLDQLGWDVTLLCETFDRRLAGPRTLTYRKEPITLGPGQDTHTATAQQHMRTGYRVAEILQTIAAREGAPDMVVGHIGWGGMLFAKEALPATLSLGYCEYYYQASGGDVGFDPTDKVGFDDLVKLKLRNITQLATLEAIDAGISPTKWQRSRYPAKSRDRIAICHDGIDTKRCRPDPDAGFLLPNGKILKPGDPVITFAARDLEPYRGFPQFMRAAAQFSKRNRDAVFVVAGGDGVSYGRRRQDGLSWREALVAETGISPERIHFVGHLRYAELIRLFQVSALHVYLTYPFVLSWSFLEAMACGCLVAGSATPPVEEVLQHGKNGLLVDFWDEDDLVDTMEDALSRPDAFVSIRAAARQTVIQRYALADCLERQRDLMERMMSSPRLSMAKDECF